MTGMETSENDMSLVTNGQMTRKKKKDPRDQARRCT